MGHLIAYLPRHVWDYPGIFKTECVGPMTHFSSGGARLIGAVQCNRLLLVVRRRRDAEVMENRRRDLPWIAVHHIPAARVRSATEQGKAIGTVIAGAAFHAPATDCADRSR